MDLSISIRFQRFQDPVIWAERLSDSGWGSLGGLFSGMAFDEDMDFFEDFELVESKTLLIDRLRHHSDQNRCVSFSMSCSGEYASSFTFVDGNQTVVISPDACRPKLKNGMTDLSKVLESISVYELREFESIEIIEDIG